MRADLPDETAGGRVIHLADRVTDEVFSFLGPATQALAESGFDQTVVLTDDLRYRHHLPRFDDRIDLVLVRARAGLLGRGLRAARALQDVVASSSTPLRAVHLHGFVPSLVGAFAMRSLRRDEVPVFYSPHGSKSLSSLSGLGRAVIWLLRPVIGRLRPQRAIASLAIEKMPLDALRSTSSVDVVESPVADAFFDVVRHESPRPLVVTGSRVVNLRSAELFAQLAVLLSDEALRLSFNWIGSADQNSQVRLWAANVSIFDHLHDDELAARLATGWVYLAPGGTRGFPVFLAEAMAVGLPCVAIDTPDHRNIIRHGETGFLCRTHEEVLRCIAHLIDTPALRAQVGDAAREAARLRFGEARFRDSLMSAYDLPTTSPGVLVTLDDAESRTVTSATPAAPPPRSPTPAGAIDLSPL